MRLSEKQPGYILLEKSEKPGVPKNRRPDNFMTEIALANMAVNCSYFQGSIESNYSTGPHSNLTSDLEELQALQRSGVNINPDTSTFVELQQEDALRTIETAASLGQQLYESARKAHPLIAIDFTAATLLGDALDYAYAHRYDTLTPEWRVDQYCSMSASLERVLPQLAAI